RDLITLQLYMDQFQAIRATLRSFLENGPHNRLPGCVRTSACSVRGRNIQSQSKLLETPHLWRQQDLLVSGIWKGCDRNTSELQEFGFAATRFQKAKHDKRLWFCATNME